MQFEIKGLPSYGAIAHLVGRYDKAYDKGARIRYHGDTKQGIIKDKLAGMKTVDVAKKYGCSTSTVVLTMRKARRDGDAA